MIDTIFFDLDGVLTLDPTGTISMMKYIKSLEAIDGSLFEKAYRKHNYNLLYGHTSHDEIWPEICRDYGNHLDIHILNEAFKATPMDEKMLKIARQLKSYGYKIGLITDNKEDRVVTILDYFELDDLFDGLVISCQIKSGKKEFMIFDHAIRSLNTSYHTSIFIDNNPKNLEIPSQSGMTTYHFDDLKRDYSNLINNLNNLLKTTISI